MGKYIKVFNNHNGYTAFTQTDAFVKPNVSHCISENEVHYKSSDYRYEYLTLVALTDGTISFNFDEYLPTSATSYIEYSTNEGTTWIRSNNAENQAVTVTVDVSLGDRVLWRGVNYTFYYFDDISYTDNRGYFSSTCQFDVQGNIMSLFYGDNFIGQTTIDVREATKGIFANCDVVNAKDLSLPATTLGIACYDSMFSGCTSLTTAPELPATILANACYLNMFKGCTSLTTAPELPATTLANKCYQSMFSGCTNLNSITCLATDISATNCTTNWLSGVASSGTFTKAASMTSWTSGANGIPNGWTVQTVST